jgi:hypothetical protein
MTTIRIIFGTAALVIFNAAAPAQEHDVFTLPVPAPLGGAPIVFQHKEGFGVAGQTFEFISSEMGLPGKVVKGAPYSAEAMTETTQILADGNRIARKNSTALYRDGEGRTRREVTLSSIGPWASASEGEAKMVFIHDPVAGTSYSLNENDKTARKTLGEAMAVSFASHASERAPEAGNVRFGVRRQIEKIAAARTEAGGDVKMMRPGIRVPAFDPKNAKTESLGKRNIEGVEAEGTRTTHTIPAGEIGNDRPIDVVSERWYSAELQTVVMTRHSDPRMGETVYKLSNLRLSEPARQLFEVPSDYKITTEDVPKMLRKPLIEVRDDR